MRTLIKIVMTIGLCLGSYSCYYDEVVPEAEIPDIPTDQEISFSEDIEPLFSRSGKECTACHNGAIQVPDLRVGNAYNALVPAFVTAGDAEGSVFFQRLPGNNHPFDVGFTLSTAEIAIIKSWIDRGAGNN
jgi:hypothetical protein